MQARQEMEKRLEQAQRMDALATLAGGIAHDFKNLLQIILGQIDLLRNSAPGSQDTGRRLDRIAAAGARANHLLQQISTFGSQTGQERKPVALALIIEETLALLAGVKPESISLTLQIDAACPQVLADPSQMKQVLFNLVTNAWQAMGRQGGDLEITLKEVRLESDPDLSRAGLPQGRYAGLTVRDTGPGMSREVLDRIFEPYFTTKKAGEGTGLGLAAVHGIIKAHHGAILPGSIPGQGSIFRIFLPAAPPNHPAGPHSSSLPNENTGAISN